MICAIQQPTFFPWIGYFEMISKVDLFIFLDNVQLVKRGWWVRNKIKNEQGELFLTVPIKKTKHIVTVEDHNTLSGLGGQVSRLLSEKNISVKSFTMVGVDKYQRSGKWEDLYRKAGIDSGGIVKRVKKVLSS